MKEKFFNLTNKSLEEFGAKSHQELWETVKQDHKGFSCELPAQFEKTVVKGENNEDISTYTMILSTEDEDRHGDIVKQDWDLKWFKKNPVLLDSHNYDSIEHIIGKLKNIRVEDNKLKAEIVFNENNPKGVMAKAMVDGGFINANSVGFIPKEFDDKGVILRSELLEDSLVSVPANARALFEKTVKEFKDEIAEIETEIKSEEENNEVINETTVKKISTITKKQIVLNSIYKAVKEIQKEEMNKKRRAIFQTLRNL